MSSQARTKEVVSIRDWVSVYVHSAERPYFHRTPDNSVFLWSICLFTQCIRNQHFQIFLLQVKGLGVPFRMQVHGLSAWTYPCVVWTLEPWLSSCRAVEAPSRHCRGAVEALSRRCRGLACRACRVTVEFLSSLSSLTPCAWASSSVEVCRGLSSSCRAVEQCRADE